MYFSEPSAAVKQVMDDFGWDRMTAERHVKQRKELQRLLAASPNPYPLGKSQHLA